MPKEYRYEGSPGTFVVRPPYSMTQCKVMERDVSAWRPSQPESNVLKKLCALRTLSKSKLEAELGVALVLADNNYEKDTAILFHLIRLHGCVAVQDAVAEMLGGETPSKDKR